MCLHYVGGCAIRWPMISIVGNTMSAVGRYLAIPTFADIQYIQQGGTMMRVEDTTRAVARYIIVLWLIFSPVAGKR